jgi:hypothetical protein
MFFCNTEIADSNHARVIKDANSLCTTSRCLVTLRLIDPLSEESFQIYTRSTISLLILCRNRPEDPIPKS